MKNYYLNAPPKPNESYMDSLIAEMVLEKALLHFQKEKILKEIDQALTTKNKDDFLRLSAELKNYL